MIATKIFKKQSTTRQFGDLDHPLWTSDFFLTIFYQHFLPDIQLFTYDIITLFHWFLVVQQFCNSAIFDFFDVFESCGLTEIFKVEKSGLNQKEKESSLLTFLESHRGWEIIIKMVLKNSVL